jgi:hypothetical protein
MSDNHQKDDHGKHDSSKKTGSEHGDHEGVVKEAMNFFRDTLGFDLNAVLSLANEEINRAAKTLAEEAKKKLPADHWLRNRVMSRVMGVIASRIESAGEKRGGAVKAVVEKLADFIEHFTFCFYDKNDPENPAKKTGEDVTKNLKEIFLKKAQERLEKAKPDQMEALTEKLRKEFEALKALEKMLREEEKPSDAHHQEHEKDEKKPEGNHEETWKTATDDIRGFNEFLREYLRQTEENTERTRAEMETDDEELSWVGKVLLSPWKLLYWIFFGKKTDKKSNGPRPPYRSSNRTSQQKQLETPVIDV